MGDESPKPASAATGAVFLSYASQDAEAARRICEALRAADVEVWFDQSQLRGGDLWDQKIRREVRDCELFIPVISAHTTSRRGGKFHGKVPGTGITVHASPYDISRIEFLP